MKKLYKTTLVKLLIIIGCFSEIQTGPCYSTSSDSKSQHKAATKIQTIMRKCMYKNGEKCRKQFIQSIMEKEYDSDDSWPGSFESNNDVAFQKFYGNENPEQQDLCYTPGYDPVIFKNFSRYIKKNPIHAREDKRLGLYTSLLHHAVFMNSQPAINCLLDGGIHPDALDSSRKEAPLHVAAQHNKIKAAKILLARNANANIQDAMHATPIHYATIESNLTMISLLYNHNGSVDAIDKNNNTPLHYAILCGSLDANVNKDDNHTNETMRTLINVHAKLNEKNNSNRTPLQYGLYSVRDRNPVDKHQSTFNISTEKSIKILVEAGADTTCLTTDEQLLLHDILQNKN